MAVSTIRRATSDDVNAVESAAARFASRHGITKSYAGQSFEDAVQLEIDMARDVALQCGSHAVPRIERLWQQCYCRALGQPYDSRLTIGYGYGYVGYSVQ